MAVNDSGALAPYRQGALWFAEGGIEALSGVVTPHANAPYAQWLGETCRHLTEIHAEAVTVEAVQLPGPLAAEWADWLTPYGLWLPLVEHADQGAAGGLLLAAETPWPELAIPMLEEWLDIWHHAWLARRKPTPWSWPRLKQRTLEWLAPEGKRPW